MVALAVWTPKRTNRWRDWRDKETEASSKLSLRHPAMLTMSNSPLIQGSPCKARTCLSCLLHFTLDWLLSESACSHPTAAQPCYLPSFPCLKDKRAEKTSERTTGLAQPSAESNPGFRTSRKQGLGLKL